MSTEDDIARRAREETDDERDRHPAPPLPDMISIDCEPGGMAPTVYVVLDESAGWVRCDEVYIEKGQAEERLWDILRADMGSGGAWVAECSLLDEKRGSQVLRDARPGGPLPPELQARLVAQLQGGDADADQALLAEIADALRIEYTPADEDALDAATGEGRR